MARRNLNVAHCRCRFGNAYMEDQSRSGYGSTGTIVSGQREMDDTIPVGIVDWKATRIYFKQAKELDEQLHRSVEDVYLFEIKMVRHRES